MGVMLVELDSDDIWSFRSGRDILEEKRLLEELAAAYSERGETNRESGPGEQLELLGWQHEVSFEYANSDIADQYDERETFTAYKDGILVEHDTTERNGLGNWHLLKLEAAYRDPAGFSRGENVDAAVVLLSDTGSARTIEQIQAAIDTRLANYFGFSVPLFVWQYPSD